jgi:hypothetical protein
MFTRIDQIIAHTNKLGSHFFSEENCKFWSTKVYEDLRQLENNKYMFLTSEKPKSFYGSRKRRIYYIRTVDFHGNDYYFETIAKLDSLSKARRRFNWHLEKIVNEQNE